MQRHSCSDGRIWAEVPRREWAWFVWGLETKASVSGEEWAREKLIHDEVWEVGSVKLKQNPRGLGEEFSGLYLIGNSGNERKIVLSYFELELSGS